MAASCCTAGAEVVKAVVTDHSGPELVSIKTDKSTYAAGETVRLTLVVRDPAGIDKEEYNACSFSLKYTDPEGVAVNEYKYFVFQEKDISVSGSTATLKGKLKLTSGTLPGTYRLNELTIHDKYGNLLCVANSDALSFTVTNANPAKLPEIVSIKADKKTVSVGGKITFTATVKNAVDDGWGNYVEFYHHDPWYYLACDFTKVSGSKYQGVLVIPEGTPAGEFCDATAYFRSKDISVSKSFDLSFTVTGTSVTPKTVTVKSLKFDKTKATDDQTVKMTVRTDRALKSPGKIRPVISNGYQDLSFSKLKAVEGKTNTYTATYKVRKTDVAGIYSFGWFNPDEGVDVPETPWEVTGSASFMLYDKKFVKLTSITPAKTDITVYCHKNNEWGDQGQVEIRVKSYQPANASIVSVDIDCEKGNEYLCFGTLIADSVFVAGVKPGKAVIRLVARDGSGVKSPKINVTVKKVLIKTIELSKTKLTLAKGGKASVKATLAPSKNLYCGDLKWTTSDKSVAKVDSAGNITAVGKGTCTVTAKADDGSGVKATVKVTVK